MSEQEKLIHYKGKSPTARQSAHLFCLKLQEFFEDGYVVHPCPNFRQVAKFTGWPQITLVTKAHAEELIAERQAKIDARSEAELDAQVDAEIEKDKLAEAKAAEAKPVTPNLITAPAEVEDSLDAPFKEPKEEDVSRETSKDDKPAEVKLNVGKPPVAEPEVEDKEPASEPAEVEGEKAPEVETPVDETPVDDTKEPEVETPDVDENGSDGPDEEVTPEVEEESTADKLKSLTKKVPLLELAKELEIEIPADMHQPSAIKKFISEKLG